MRERDYLIVTNLAKVRIAEQNAALKRDMIAQGYTADEIVRVLNAGSEKGEAVHDAPRPARCHR